jgi:tetratricopeptide (TPR) repeat protein
LDETNPHYVRIQKLQQNVQYFLNERLSLDSVNCEPARFAFNTAEREALDLYRKIGDDVEFDFSPPLGYYGKGLEILLNEVVWSEIRTNVLTEFSTENEYGIPSKLYSDLSKFWRSGPLSTFPNTNKTMSLGSWAKINKKDNGHPVIDSIIRQLREKYGDDYKLIKQASAFLAPYRNEVFHAVVVKDKNEVLELRNKVIKHLHNVIEVLYGSETTEYFNDTFKEHHNDIALVDEAQKQIRAGNDEGAFSLLLDALKIDPDNSDALVTKAQIHIRRKEFNKARGLIEKALSIDSDDYDALHEMGVLHFEEGKYDAAADYFQKTIRIKSDHDLAWLNLGCSFMEMFDHSMAIKCLQEAAKLNPDDENIIKEIEFCEGALENALASLPKVEENIALNPEDFDRYSLKGFLLFMLGKYSESLYWLNRAIEKGDEDSGTYLLKGQALLRLNRLDEANEAFDKYKVLKE